MKKRRYLVFGAHPDDADIRFGGSAIKLIKAGHEVKFVSLANGCCGHLTQSGKELADRRYAETRAAAKLIGLAEYEVWQDRPDCELEATVANRRRVIRIIRNFAPDVVLGPRLCDYHADHRAAGQLVQDAAYLTMVPQYCADTPIPAENPVFGCVWDSFTDPRPFRTDAAVAIDEVMEEKCRLLDCQVSQFYEWLAWEHKVTIDLNTITWAEKRAYLEKYWGARYERAANDARQVLIETYGEAGKSVRYAECFEFSPYGRKVTVEEFRKLLNPEL